MEKPEWSDLFAADLAVADPEIARLIAAQERQNRATVNLVASETYCPAATLAAEASELVNKNAGGYPPRVSFNGGATMDAIERLAIERAKAIFGAEHANIQSLSATIANIAVLRALLHPGDRLRASTWRPAGTTATATQSTSPAPITACAASASTRRPAP